MFDEYRHFLPKNHSYRTTYKEKLNGKEENGKNHEERHLTYGTWNIKEIVKVCQIIYVLLEYWSILTQIYEYAKQYFSYFGRLISYTCDHHKEN